MRSVRHPGHLSKGSTTLPVMDALTARGEEAHLPQEEGGVHVAQGLLHVPKAGVAGPGRENKPEDEPYHREGRVPAPHPRQAGE